MIVVAQVGITRKQGHTADGSSGRPPSMRRPKAPDSDAGHNGRTVMGPTAYEDSPSCMWVKAKLSLQLIIGRTDLTDATNRLLGTKQRHWPEGAGAGPHRGRPAAR